MNATHELTALALTATLLSAGTAVAAPAPAAAPAVQAAAAEAEQTAEIKEDAKWSTLGITATDTVCLKFVPKSDGTYPAFEFDTKVTLDSLLIVSSDPTKTAQIMLTNPGSAVVRRTVAEANVRVPQNLLFSHSRPRIEVAKDVVLEVPVTESQLVNAFITGKVENGTLARGWKNGGTLKKTGAGKLTLEGPASYNPGYKDPSNAIHALDSVTLEIAEGVLRTEDSPKIWFSAMDCRFKFSGKDKKDPWPEMVAAHRFLGEVTFEVAEGLEVGRGSNPWFMIQDGQNTGKPPAEMSHLTLVKTGPGAIRLAPYRKIHTIVRDGTWLLDNEVDSGSYFTVAQGGCLARDPGASAFGGKIVFDDGAAIAYSSQILELTGTVEAGNTGTDGKCHLRLVGTPALGVTVLKAALPETVVLDAPKGYKVVSEGNVHKLQVDGNRNAEETFGGGNPTEWTPDGAYKSARLILQDNCELTIKASLTAEKLTLVGNGTVKLAPGVQLSAAQIVIEGDVTLDPRILCTNQKTPGALMPDVTIARGKTASLTLPAGTAYFHGRLLSPAGTGVCGKLSVTGASGAEFGFRGRGRSAWIADGTALELDGVKLYTWNDVCLNGAELSFKGNVGRDAWTYSKSGDIYGRIYSAAGRETVLRFGKGVAMVCGAWFSGAYRKAGPGSFCFAPLARNNKDGEKDLPLSSVTVEEGTWQQHPDARTPLSDEWSVAKVCSGAVIANRPEGGGKFTGVLTFEAGAVVSCENGAVVADKAVAPADGGTLKAVLPAEPNEEAYDLLKTSNGNLVFEAPRGWETVCINGLYKAVRSAADVTETLSGNTEKALPERIGNLTLGLKGHILTVTNTVKAKRLTVVGPGTLRFADKASIDVIVGGVSVSGDVVLPPSLIASASTVLDIARNGKVTLNADSELKLQGVYRSPAGEGDAGILRKEGTGNLTLCGRGKTTPMVDGACLEIAEGSVFTENHVTFRGGVLHLEAGAGGWSNAGGSYVSSVGSETELRISGGKNARCSAWFSGDFRKTGPGEGSFAIRDGGSVVTVAEGTWRLHADGSGGTNPKIVVLPGAALRGPSGTSFWYTGSVVMKDGSRIIADPRPATKGTIEMEGRVFVETAPGAKEGDSLLWQEEKYTAGLAKHMVVGKGSFVAKANVSSRNFTLAALTLPAEVTPESELGLALKEAAAGAGVAKTVLDLGMAGGKPLTEADAEKALTVFENISTVTADADTATVKVGYDFGIVSAKASADALKVTVAVRQTDGTPAKLAPGTVLKLMSGETVLATANTLSTQGEALFSVPLSSLGTGTKFTVKAVNAK